MGCPSLVTKVCFTDVVDSLNSIGFVCDKSTKDIAEAMTRLSFIDKKSREELIYFAKKNYFYKI